MRNVHWICLAAALATCLPSTAWTDEPYPERGLDLALRWCSSCHIIGPAFDGGDVGPTFESVATRPGQTKGALRAFLAEPHEPMPDFQLTADQYDDLIAHIMSLRE